MSYPAFLTDYGYVTAMDQLKEWMVSNKHLGPPFQIKWGATALVLSGNVFIFVTILAYFLIFTGEDDWGF